MLAIVRSRYGGPDALRFEEVARPEPNDDQVLVRVRAVSVNPADWHGMRGEPWLMRLGQGLTTPKSAGLGADLAGTVEAVGRDVTHVRPGDDVFGMSVRTFAEYAAVAGDGVVPKPASVSFEQAAAVPVAGLTALQGLRDVGRLEPGQRVLVNGAAGGVGTFAVQLAKALGAAYVAGVCSTRNVELVRSLGADEVVDYTRSDFTRSGERYHLVLDAVGNRSLSELRRAATPAGTIVLVGAAKGRSGGRPLLRLVRAVVARRFVSQEVATFLAKRNADDLRLLGRLLASGEVTPVVDRTYPLREIAEAIRYVEAGHARGKVVVTV